MQSALILKIIGLHCVQFEFETSSSKTCVTENISQRPTDDTGATIRLAPSVNGTDRHYEGVGTSKHNCLCILFIRLTTCFGHCGPSSGHKNI